MRAVIARTRSAISTVSEPSPQLGVMRLRELKSSGEIATPLDDLTFWQMRSMPPRKRCASSRAVVEKTASLFGTMPQATAPPRARNALNSWGNSAKFSR